MQDHLLIVGIDPGMTTAYAALNTRGELIKLKSEKHLPLSTIVTEVTQAGKIIAVGTDVKYSPKFVEKFCSRLGAKLISPREDMKIGYKERLTEHYRHHDDHQRDALAGAIFAYQELKPLLKKIDLHVKREGKEHLSYEVILLAMKGMPITEALRHLEEKKETITTKKRIRSKIKKSTAIMELNNALQRENKELRQEVVTLQQKLDRVSHDIDTRLQEKIRKTLDIKEKKISDAHLLIGQHKKEIVHMQEKMVQLNQLLLSSQKKIVIKHLKDLGWNEVKSISQHDSIILVDDVNIFSEKAWGHLKNSVSTIIFKVIPSKAIVNKPFHFINAKNVHCEEFGAFAVVEKESLEKEKRKTNVLSKIIQEYQEERHHNI